MTALRWTFSGLAVALSALVVACSPGGAASDDRPRASASPPIASAPRARPKIVALGDSLTAGLGLLQTEAYPGLLQEKIDRAGYDFEVVNAGVSGDTTAGGLRRLDWALEGDVRVIIVALGANDGLRGLSIDEMKQNLLQIVRRANERHVTVILAGMEAPPNYGQEYAVAFRHAFADVARQQRVTFVPFLLDRVAGHGDLNQADGIHPNPNGARIVAETLWTVLRPIVEQMAAAR
jgi:acyl-CoA thioesterase-1